MEKINARTLLLIGVCYMILWRIPHAHAQGQGHIRCQNTIGRSCGDSSRPREMNCCDYGYCQPWNSGYYQCVDYPRGCPIQKTDTDMYGNDMATFSGLQPWECCNKCGSTPGCMAYTFINQNPDGSSKCYLKNAVAVGTEKKGAVSGVLSNPVCSKEAGSTCGSSKGYSCCTNGNYCQPWDSGFYQCLSVPEQCPEQETDMDYYGFDIKTIYGLQPGECCTKCTQTNGCVAYTFINENPDGKTACYLKSDFADRRPKVGAVSGKLKDPTICQTPVGGPCGNDEKGVGCCPEGTYCQPWNSGYYQCLVNPRKTQCPSLEVGVDYWGNDIDVKYGLLPWECCDACFSSNLCNAWTFVNSNPDGKSACYLKSAIGEKKQKLGAVSGNKIQT